VTPAQFEVNSTISITGNDLNLSGVQVFLGPAALAITPPAGTSQLTCVVNGPISNGTVLSAGSHPLFVRQTLPSGRFRWSNLLVGNLLPALTTATVPAAGKLRLNGELLGTPTDDVLVAFYHNGAVERMFDDVTSNPNQTQLDLTVPTMPPDNYRIILRVNGQQARNSPEVAWP